MKKLLLIFLALAISFSAISQTDHKKGAKSDVINESTSGVGVTIESLLIKDGVTRYDDSLSAHSDSITVHRRVIDSLNAVTLAANYKIAVLEGADITSPYADSAWILPGRDSTIFILFDEPMSGNVTYDIDTAFTFTYNGAAGSVDSANASGSATVLVHCATHIPTTDTVYLSYTKPATGGLRDLDNNYVADFDTFLVFNGVNSVLYVADAYWKFNGDLTDEYGTYTGTDINTIEYTGDTALIFSGSDGNDAVQISSPMSGDFSVSMWVYLDEGTENEDYYLFSNSYTAGPDGFYFLANGSGAGTFALQTWAEDGSGTGRQYAWDGDYTMLDDTWNHVVATFDVDGNGTNAYNSFYLNGVDVTTDSILTGMADFNVTNDINIGANKGGTPAGGLREGAILGEVAIFDHRLALWEIDSLYEIRGDRLWYVNKKSTPDDYDSARTVHETVDFTGAIPFDFAAVTYDAMIDTMETWFASGSVSSTPNTRNFCGIADYLGDTCLSVYLPSVYDAGMQILAGMPGDYDEVWLSYNFWVPSNFESPNVMGKWPGVSGYKSDSHSLPSGAVALPDGGVFPYWCTDNAPADIYYKAHGFTARGLIIMDRANPSGGLGGFGVYLYHHGLVWKKGGDCSTKTYGEYIYGGTTWPKGTWNNITYRYKANSVDDEGTGNADGIIETYRNGICTAYRDDVVFREYSDAYIDLYNWGAWHGGGWDYDRTWSTNVYFDDFELWMPGPKTSIRRPGPNPIGTDITGFINQK